MFTLANSCLTTSNFALIHGPNIPDSSAILFFTASNFIFTIRHIHNWALLTLWLSLFIPSGVISLLFSSSVWYTYWPGGFIFQCRISLPFHTIHGVLKARLLNCFPFPSSVDHILFKLSTMTYLSWVALCSMAHSFIELGEAVIHVICLVIFLWLWFSFCLPSDGWE